MSQYDDNPTTEDFDRPSITVNGTEYQLSAEVLSMVEGLADREYGENEFLDYYWRIAGTEGEHDAGDPILVIETEGPMVPREDLTEMKIEPANEPVPQDVDNGDTTMEQRDDENNELEDLKQVIYPKDFRAYPDPEDDDFDTLPPEPEAFNDDEPEMITPIPDSDRDERWSSGRAIVAKHSHVEWNVQKRADSAANYVDNNLDDHDAWEAMLQGLGCTELGSVDTSTTPDDPDEALDGKYGGDNFHV